MEFINYHAKHIQSDNMVLCIELASSYAALFLVDKPRKTLFAAEFVANPDWDMARNLRALADQWKSSVRNLEIDDNQILEVYILLLCSQFDLVPETLYLESSQRDYLSLLKPVTGDHRLMHDNIDNPQAHLLFALPNDVFTLSFARFHRPVLIHSGKSLISLVHQYKLLHAKGLSLILNFYPGQCEYVLYKGFDLQIYQVVSYLNPEDLIYNLFSVLEKFGGDFPLNKIWCLGKIDEPSKEIILLKKFIGKKYVEMFNDKALGKLLKPSGLESYSMANLLATKL